MAINLGHALTRFNQAGIDPDADFHTLSSSQVEVVLECAKADRYRKPLHSTGSTARAYFQAVQRLNNRSR